VIVVVDGRLALIDRVREGVAPYSSIPGGGLEAGESFADAAVREAREELGLDVELRSPTPLFVLGTGDSEHQYFRVDVRGGVFGDSTGPEFQPGGGRGTYTPVLVTPDEAFERSIVPFELTEELLRAFVTGEWPETTVELTDPRLTPPRRIRAGAICLDDDDRVLVHRGEWRYGPYYALPGGGVEHGETPEEAVVRELEEEAGLHVRIDRRLADVWRNGGLQHYFLVRPERTSGRTTLDLEPGHTEEWLPIAALADVPVWPKRLAWRVVGWHANGRWPDHPLSLIDSIADLRPRCRW
jgi:ADP-ribose pyrophosphatase YjhB (NUDIX family)